MITFDLSKNNDNGPLIPKTAYEYPRPYTSSAPCNLTKIEFEGPDIDSSGNDNNPNKRTFDNSSGSESDHLDKLECTHPSPSKRRRSPERQSMRMSPGRPFACPYFQNNSQVNLRCSKWQGRDLKAVTDHILGVHIRPLRCGRCKVFEARSYKQITKHLMRDNCEKSGTHDTYEQDIALKKTMLESATSWEQIYSVLYPHENIPSPSLQDETIVLGNPNPLENRKPLLTLRFSAAIPYTQPAYRQDLAEYLATHLAEYLATHIIDLPSGYMDELQSEFDQQWANKTSVLERYSESEPEYIRVGFFQAQPHDIKPCAIETE